MQHQNADILTMLVLPAQKTTGKLLILILLMILSFKADQE